MNVVLLRPPAMICATCCHDPKHWHTSPVAVYCDHSQHAAMWSKTEGQWLVQIITREQFDVLPELFAQRGKSRH